MELTDFLNDKKNEILELGMVEYLSLTYGNHWGVKFRLTDPDGKIISSKFNDLGAVSENMSEYSKITESNNSLTVLKNKTDLVFIAGVFIEHTLNGIIECEADLNKIAVDDSDYSKKESFVKDLFLDINRSIDLFLVNYKNVTENKILQTRVRHSESSVEVLRKEHQNIQAVNIQQREELEKTNEELLLKRRQLEDYGKNLEKKVEDRTRELQVAKDKAEDANKLKSQLLANMSHEMRTPLNSIIGFTELILEDKLESGQRDYMEKVNRNGALLLLLINDILDLSKIQANQMKLEKIPAAINKFIMDTEANANSLILQKKQSIDIRKVQEQGISDYIICDPVRLQQIMNNLMSNAVKFTDKGYIEYGISLKNKKTLQFYFKDTGIGISKENSENIFESFQQADMSTTRKFGGTGLGLTITKQIITLMGGDIWLESVPGKGTIFYFTIPYVPCEKGVSDDLGGKDEEFEDIPLNILVAEDSIDNQLLADRILSKKGHRVIIANNGQEALDTYLEKHENIDIILMDIQMPILGGLEASVKIRNAEADKSIARTPIIALTANAMKGVEEECLVSGCDGYSTKPLNKKELFPLINKLADKKNKL